MSDDEERELGEALRHVFSEVVPDLEPSDRLRANVSAFGSRRSRWKLGAPKLSRRITAGITAAASAAAIAVIAFSQATVSPSFAIAIEANRSVQITLYQLSGAAGANSRLKALGVRAKFVPMRSGCSTRVTLTTIGIRQHPAPTLRLVPREIPAGITVVLAARRLGQNHFEIAFGRVTGKAPSCVAPEPLAPIPGGQP
jgi:hypothetical protein